MNRRAFTLVELLVVLAIAAIIIVVIVRAPTRPEGPAPSNLFRVELHGAGAPRSWVSRGRPWSESGGLVRFTDDATGLDVWVRGTYVVEQLPEAVAPVSGGAR